MTLARARELKGELEAAFARGVAPIAMLEGLAELEPENAFLRSLRGVPVRQIADVMTSQSAAVLGRAARARPLDRPIAAIGGHADDGPPPRMAVGYAQTEKGFELEIRLQNPDVGSLLLARQLVTERVDLPARIGILKKLVVHGMHPAAMTNDTLTLGSSVGHAKGLAGSLGLFVQQGSSMGILSCSHVLARAGKAGEEDEVFHPSPKDDPLHHGAIGRLRRFVNLADTGAAHTADIALAILHKTCKISGNVVPRGHDWPSEGRGLGEVFRNSIVKNTLVAKIGRTSGWTTGRVLHENLGPVEIHMPDLNRNVVVSGLTEIEWPTLDEPFSDRGDSGSVAFLAETLQPIGLVVAGGRVEISADGVTKTHGASYACPLASVLKDWKLTLAM